jgi:hypothetical protein
MISLLEFKQRVGHLDGTRLVTPVRKRGFTVHVTPGGLEYIPESSGLPRPDSWDRVAAVIDRYNETGSRQPGDYQDLTHHASYVLSIIANILGGRPNSR